MNYFVRPAHRLFGGATCRGVELVLSPLRSAKNVDLPPTICYMALYGRKGVLTGNRGSPPPDITCLLSFHDGNLQLLSIRR